jgi:YidC/Oxa1 family membrane protein insertase
VLDFIYYPVSFVMWVWHRAFGYVFGVDSGVAWALSVVFLVFTIRLVLYKPFVSQVRTTRQMQELQPQIKALQTKYKNDRQQMATEMQKLQREHGFNPLMGCLPALVQMPVFIGLFHVLNSFNRTAKGAFGMGNHIRLTPQQNASIGNYFFSATDVQSFLKARLFGAPLSSYITASKQQLDAFKMFGPVPHWTTIAVVAVPLMIFAALATHFNARASTSRQSPEALANPQAAMMNKLALWVFPFGVLVSGPMLPIAVLLYWVSNNIWTYAQQHLVFGRIERDEAAKREVVIERRARNAPKPGAKPKRSNKHDDGELDAPVVDERPNTSGTASTNGAATAAKQTPGPSAPKPGAKPAAAKKGGTRGRANQKKRR